MEAVRIPIDSEVFGSNVLSLYGVTREDDIAAEESRYLAEFSPTYVSCRVPIEDLAVIHLLEKHGFRFIECQIRSVVRFGRDYDVSRYPYGYEQVTSEKAINSVLEIASKTIVHDRFTMDDEVPMWVSGERYRRYVRKSFDTPDEEVWRLFDPETDATLAFRTHKHTEPGQILMLLGGVHPDFKNLGLGIVSSHFCFNQLRNNGVRRGITHISAINYPIFNLEIGSLGFRVLASFAILRKTYPQNK